MKAEPGRPRAWKELRKINNVKRQQRKAEEYENQIETFGFDS